MEVHVARRRGVGRLAALLAGVLLLMGVVGVAPAQATNEDTVSGNESKACSLEWNAETWMDQDGVPGYDTDREGKPVDYSNGGYVKEVSPSFGDPGLFEIQHWISGNTMFWRIPLASDHGIHDGKLTVTLPSGFDYSASNTTHDYVMDDSTPVEWKTRWKTTKNFTDIAVTENVVTVPIEMVPGSHYVGLQITATAPAGTDMRQTFKATAKLIGQMNEGDGCEVTVPDEPNVPAEEFCEQLLTGRTTRPLDAADITARDKKGDGGETNSDGWARTFRLYGATDNALDTVTYTATASQGFTFKAGSASTVLTGDDDSATDNLGLGQLDNNGYDGIATGIGIPQISADGKTVTLTIANMPKKGVFAFNVDVVPDGSGKQMVVDHVMRGKLSECKPIGPTFNKIGEDRKPLPGAALGGVTCTRWDSDLNWQCQDLTEYSWFASGFTQSGTTGDNFTNDIAMRAPAAGEYHHCVAVWEKTAPAGYDARTQPMLVCQTKDGWVNPGAEVSIDVDGYGTVTGGMGYWETRDNYTFDLVNRKTVLGPTFNKVDENGAFLSGAVLGGYSCTKFNNEPEWTCISLADYSWFGEDFTSDGSTEDSFTTQIDMERPTDPTGHCVIVWEKTAPGGYVKKSKPMMVCQTKDGWTTTPDVTINAGGKDYTPGLGDWTASDDGYVFNLKNEKKSAPPVKVTKTRKFQVDTYNSPTTKLAKKAAGYDNDDKLKWGEDKLHYGHSSYQFVSVTVNGTNKWTRAQWDAAFIKGINAKTKKGIGNVYSTGHIGAVKKGQKITHAWEVRPGSSWTTKASKLRKPQIHAYSSRH